MKEYDLTGQEQALLAAYRQAINSIQQQCIGAQQALCAIRGIKGPVEFTDTKILVAELPAQPTQE